ncbi:hypothetical protein LNQ49_02720 [Flavobacterium sp. F-65]|uniref:Uncharacterized protein n=1 Tax=Flavobacterium pisciphilum TaxID=2893755 RepID=A0ABS8MP25_9FLAO|nr:hypothetical protein [Flavobacterium sp. F-65]MCC9070512.1 hypothetical protein [Flavobacterium sp. F-65]
MKPLKSFFIGIVFITVSALHAQVSVNVNIGSPPSWGPVGYTDVRYYYLPDLEMYYDINASSYIYFNSGKWIRTRNLPRNYRNYDLYNGYKVVLTDYRGNTPYNNFNNHKLKYGKGYKGKPQETIGRKPGKGNNKEYWDDKHGNGRGNGHGHGHGNGKH